jgi:hypothetical protein
LSFTLQSSAEPLDSAAVVHEDEAISNGGLMRWRER